jgi:GT2 family glycosyltransferase
MTLHVAVAIVGFRNADDIAHCLAALGRSTYADFEVAIFENGGEAAYAALTAILPTTLEGGQPVHVELAPRNLGYAGGVNACLAATPSADAWWVLNPDTAPEPGALAALVERLAVGDCQAVGGTLVRPDGLVQSYGGRWRGWLARAESIGRGATLDEWVDAAAVESRQSYLSGASMLIGRKFLATVGVMREDYFLYCEEVEWFLRAARVGMRLGFAPDARVVHAHGATTGSGEHVSSRPRMPIYLDERNKILVTRDCFPRRLPIAALSAFALIFARYGRQRAWPQLGYGLSGWLQGVLNRRGAPPFLPA